jgi:TetR/AcrR family transcriptional repressor of nem operon
VEVARAREFDEDDVLERAMQLFWARGYEATTVADLTAELGLSKGSLYNAFGDKHTLFLAALGRYGRGPGTALAAALPATGPVLPRLGELLHELAEHIAADPTRRGCFVVNSTSELAARDDQVAACAREVFRALADALRTALTRARDQGELAPDADPRHLAHFLVDTVQGMQVTGKADPDPARLHATVDVALSALVRAHPGPPSD